MKLLFLLTLFSWADKELLLYRELMVQAEKAQGAASVFYQQSKKIGPGSKPVLLGYKAMSCFFMSKHALSPLHKLGYFREGKKSMEQAILLDSSVIELYYLRFSVQSNLPAFLGYRQDLASDKNRLLLFLQKNNSQDTDLSRRIFNFISQSPQLSAAEKKTLTHGR